MARSTYVRPHKHANKSESVHVIEGWADVVLFDDGGGVSDLLRIGAYGSDRTFYYRLSAPIFHTLVIGSEQLVVHETTNGPFKPMDTIFAPWSPDENDVAARDAFMRKLRAHIESFACAGPPSAWAAG